MNMHIGKPVFKLISQFFQFNQYINLSNVQSMLSYNYSLLHDQPSSTTLPYKKNSKLPTSLSVRKMAKLLMRPRPVWTIFWRASEGLCLLAFSRLAKGKPAMLHTFTSPSSPPVTSWLPVVVTAICLTLFVWHMLLLLT